MVTVRLNVDVLWINVEMNLAGFVVCQLTHRTAALYYMGSRSRTKRRLLQRWI